MLEKKDDGVLTPTESAAGRRIDSTDAAADVLKSREDLSYQFFDGVELSNIVARQSLFNGVLFRNCTISDSDFSRSDFEGARFENCTLTNVSFETADIRSTKFAKTILRSCTFRSAAVSDNLFSDSEIASCEFEDGSILNCIFDNCIVQEVKNRTAAWLHTTFIKTRLESVSFTDCTSIYAIYDRCSFKDVVINADSLGLTFGITESNLKDLNFGFLGQKYDSGMSPGIESFLEQYKNRNWRIHSLILSLNFKTKDKQTILQMLLEELRTQIKNRRSAKKDDLEFIFRIMSFLESKQQLPFSSAIFAYDIFAELSFEVDKRSLENIIVEIGEQKSNYIVNSMYESLMLALNPILDIEQTETIEAKITYRSKPKTTTLEYVDKVFLIAEPESSETILVEAREGSWIEIIRMTVESLFAFYVALYLVNGCLVQLTMMRARSKNLIAKRLPPKFLQAASSPSHDLPKGYSDILQKLVLSQLSGNKASIEALSSLSRKDVDEMTIEVKELNI